jgi:hypothetical protein
MTNVLYEILGYYYYYYYVVFVVCHYNYSRCCR